MAWLARASILVSLALGACSSALSPAGLAQEAVQDLNLHARFGRNSVASDYVASSERAAFQERRREWGGSVRVVDSEIAGMVKSGQDRYDVIVRVSWYRQDEGELRVTDIHQKWEASADKWRLTAEERETGDLGLLGDAPPPETRAKRENVHLPTVRIPAE
jgi:hypothetical protein